MKRITYIFWFIFQAYSAPICTEIYKIPSTSLEKGVCKMNGGNQNNQSTTIIYVQKCYPAFHCEGNSSSVGLCKADYSLKIEEENCNFNFDCYSNNCTNNVCYPIKLGGGCQNHFQCSISAFCDQKICKKLVANGGSCSDDFQCDIGNVCSRGKCVKMFSLEKGDRADNKYVCKSGYTINNICAETKSAFSLKRCESNKDCSIEVDIGNGNIMNSTGTCECNLEGVKYCSLTSSSKEWQNYVDTFNSEIKKIEGIHIAGMRNATNAQSWGSSAIVDSYRKFDVKYINVNKDILIALGNKFLFFHKIIVSLLFFMI